MIFSSYYFSSQIAHRLECLKMTYSLAPTRKYIFGRIVCYTHGMSIEPAAVELTTPIRIQTEREAFQGLWVATV